MEEVNLDHEYEYKDGVIIDIFGDEMNSVDEYAEEMDMLLNIIKNLQYRLNAK